MYRTDDHSTTLEVRWTVLTYHNLPLHEKYLPQTNLATSNPSEEAQYRRVQYYNRLQNQTGINLDVLVGSHIRRTIFHDKNISVHS